MNPFTYLRLRRAALAARIERDRQQAQWFVEAMNLIARQKQLIENYAQYIADIADEPTIYLKLAKLMAELHERTVEVEKIEPVTTYKN